MGDARWGPEPDRLRGSRSRECLSAGGNHLLEAKDLGYLNATFGTSGVGPLEHLGLDLWKCAIFRRLVCLLLFIC